MINLATIQAKLIVAAVIVSISFASGWKVSSWRNEAGYAETLKKALAQQQEEMVEANKASLALERTKLINEAKTKIASKTIEDYAKKNPKTQCFNAEALTIYNSD